MYQIYKNQKPFAAPSSSREFLEYGMKKLKEKYPHDAWHLEGPGFYGEFRGRAGDLIPGHKYQATWSNGRAVTFIGISERSGIDESGNAAVDVEFQGRIYMASSLQLFSIQ